MDKVVILARVSTQAQDYQRQVTELQEYCDRAGWEVTRVFANKVSGAKAVTERAEIIEMVEYIKSNDVKRVVCLEISRLGRNTLEALKVINYLNENGVSLYVKLFLTLPNFVPVKCKALLFLCSSPQILRRRQQHQGCSFCFRSDTQFPHIKNNRGKKQHQQQRTHYIFPTAFLHGSSSPLCFLCLLVSSFFQKIYFLSSLLCLQPKAGQKSLLHP